jgi:anti-sigma regulatory factor (Ser/Thr protein kinase)
MNINPEFGVSKITRVFYAGAYKMDDVYDFISEAVHASNADVSLLKMVADEIFANIMSYAYEKDADKWVALDICLEDETVTMTFIDGGRPFDPISAPTPDVTLSAAEREIGGLGIYIARSVMDEASYSRNGDRNILTARKKISRET